MIHILQRPALESEWPLLRQCFFRDAKLKDDYDGKRGKCVRRFPQQLCRGALQ